MEGRRKGRRKGNSDYHYRVEDEQNRRMEKKTQPHRGGEEKWRTKRKRKWRTKRRWKRGKR